MGTSFEMGSHPLTLLVPMGLYSILDVAIGVLALMVRRRLGPINPGALILAVFGFLFWEGFVQATMSAMLRLLH